MAGPIRLRSSSSRWLAIAIACSIVLAILYFWSRGGQTYTIRVEVTGQRVVAFVDGRQVFDETFDGMAESGGIAVVINPREMMPSITGPNGIDHLTVRDTAGSVVFEDAFSGSVDAGAWTVARGQIRESGGVWEAGDGQTQIYAPGPWRDFVLEARFRNVTSVEVAVRARSADSGTFVAIRPIRLIDSSMSLREDGRFVEGYSHAPLRLDSIESMRLILAMALRPLPLLVLLTGAGIVLFTAATWLPMPNMERLALRIGPLPAAAGIAGMLALFAFAATAILITGPAEGVPHVPDELSYIFQAEVLASGRFSMPPPAIEEVFRWSNPAPILIHEGRWASMYPPVHPLALAVGALIDEMWLVPPLIGAACVYLLFLTGRRTYDTRTGLLAAALFAISPFFLMTASNFMSHNTTAFFVIAALYFFTRLDDPRPAMPLLAGVALGLVFAARPLTGVTLVPPFGLFLLAGLPSARTRRLACRNIALVTAGGIVVLAGYLFYQYMITGNPLHVETTQGGENAFGFGGAHTLNVGLSNEQAQLSYLLLVLHNWTPAIGLMLLLVPFVLGTTSRWDWFLLACVLFLTGAYTLYFVNGIMHGPRYWYEATPMLMLLSARGVAVGAERLTMGAAAIHERLRGSKRALSPSLAYGLLVVPVLLLAGHGSKQWLFDTAPWRAEFMPESAAALEGFNGIDGRFTTLLQEAGLEDALVLVDDCINWHCYGIAFWLNEPSLDGEAVYARYIKDRPEMMMDLFSLYPERRVYRANFPNVTLRPFHLDGQEPPAEAPRRQASLSQGPCPVRAPSPPKAGTNAGCLT